MELRLSCTNPSICRLATEPRWYLSRPSSLNISPDRMTPKTVVVMMPTLSPGADTDGNVGIMTTLDFQWILPETSFSPIPQNASPSRYKLEWFAESPMRPSMTVAGLDIMCEKIPSITGHMVEASWIQATALHAVLSWKRHVLLGLLSFWPIF